MTTPVVCHHCRGRRITPPTETCAAAGFPYLMYDTPNGGVFSQGIRLAWKGCACLDCGHVMLFLTDHALGVARAQPTFIPRAT